jgi:outer membrane protein TolC
MRYKTKTILIALILVNLFHVNLNAQQPQELQVYQITAKDAIDIAFKNLADIKNAKLDYKAAEARNKEFTGLALPQVTGSLQGNHYLTLPLIQFPDGSEVQIYDVLRQEGVKDGSGNPITKTGEFNYRNFSFITPWNVNAGLSVNQLLFEPQIFIGLKARDELLVNSDLQLKVTEEKVKETVYRNYYGVLIAQKQLGYVVESIKRLEKLEHDQTEMFKNGFAERLDIDKTTVNLNNTKTSEIQLRTATKNGLALLKMNLGLTQADSLILKDTLSPDGIRQGILEDDFSYENRNEVKLLNSAIKLQNYDIRRHKLSYFPTLSAFYNFQENGQRQGGDATGTQPWFWYNTNLVGINVSVPIFDGFQKKNRIKQSQFTLEKVQNTLDMTKKGIDMEKTVAKNTLINAIVAMDAQEKNMELAVKVFNSVKIKYEQGVGSSFELLQADTDLQQAQSNYFRAMYEAALAKINYLKALGRL